MMPQGRTIILIPIETSVGLISISLGIIHAIKRKKVSLKVFGIATQPLIGRLESEQTITSLYKNSDSLLPNSTELSQVESLFSEYQKDVLLELIISNYYDNLQKSDAEVILIEGLTSNYNQHWFAQLLNFEIAKALNAEIVLVTSQGRNLTTEKLKKSIEKISTVFHKEINNNNIAGIVFNNTLFNNTLNSDENALDNNKEYHCNYFNELANKNFRTPFTAVKNNSKKSKYGNSNTLSVLGVVPWNSNLVSARAIDLARHLNARIINKGDINTRRIKTITCCIHNIPYVFDCFCEGSLLIISADRIEILVAACLAVMNGVKIGGILLTGCHEIDYRIKKFCEQAFSTGLPLFVVKSNNNLQIFLQLQNFGYKISEDDYDGIKNIQEYVANYIDTNWINSLTIKTSKFSSKYVVHNFSPPVFRYRLTELAKKADRCIVLPEGNEPRTIEAAAFCAKRGIATCILLGNHNEITDLASSRGITLGSKIEIFNPEIIRERYVARLVELRKHKGMTEILARKQLKDNVVLGTLMLEQGEVDGMVSGAVHTTANTIRPALQIFKTAPGNFLVSSIFFMLLPEQVYIYGDCAINQNPTAEQLAEIAIQSADSAIAFGIEPRVAMLSYSTGTSALGTDVDKVRKATRIAQAKRVNLMIDGPLQYDAAVAVNVAKFKAPHSLVAGHANVFIFPDLNAGNITYKAVQRTAGTISIGPMLQGMGKPVNDLSRGALVDDIIYTIALTVIQSSQKKQK